MLADEPPEYLEAMLEVFAQKAADQKAEETRQRLSQQLGGRG